jgi:hypothetical protein
MRKRGAESVVPQDSRNPLGFPGYGAPVDMAGVLGGIWRACANVEQAELLRRSRAPSSGEYCSLHAVPLRAVRVRRLHGRRHFRSHERLCDPVVLVHTALPKPFHARLPLRHARDPGMRGSVARNGWQLPRRLRQQRRSRRASVMKRLRSGLLAMHPRPRLSPTMPIVTDLPWGLSGQPWS